jgi:hypothetical protein
MRNNAGKYSLVLFGLFMFGALLTVFILLGQMEVNDGYHKLADFNMTRHWTMDLQCQYGQDETFVMCWNGWIGGEYTYQNSSHYCDMQVITADPGPLDDILQRLTKYPLGPIAMWSQSPEIDNMCLFTITDLKPTLITLLAFLSISTILLIGNLSYRCKH